MIRFPHFHWFTYRKGLLPERSDWFCLLRRCRCGKQQYESFNTFGTGHWHDVNDPAGCQPWEFSDIMRSAKMNDFKL